MMHACKYTSEQPVSRSTQHALGCASHHGHQHTQSINSLPARWLQRHEHAKALMVSLTQEAWVAASAWQTARPAQKQLCHTWQINTKGTLPIRQPNSTPGHTPCRSAAQGQRGPSRHEEHRHACEDV